MRTRIKNKSSPQSPSEAPAVAAKPYSSWLEYYPEATLFLARWTNAVAILNVLSDEFQALAKIAA